MSIYDENDLLVGIVGLLEDPEDPTLLTSGYVLLGNDYKMRLGVLNLLDKTGYLNNIGALGKTFKNYNQLSLVSDILTISHPEDAGEDDHLVIGQIDNASLSFSNSTGPVGELLGGSWYVKEYAEVGGVDIEFDLSSFTTPPVGDHFVLVYSSIDPAFLTFTTQIELHDIGNGRYVAYNVDLSDDSYLTVGISTHTSDNGASSTVGATGVSNLSSGLSYQVWDDENFKHHTNSACHDEFKSAQLVLDFDFGDDYNLGLDEDFSLSVSFDLKGYHDVAAADLVFTETINLVLTQDEVEKRFVMDVSNFVDPNLPVPVLM
jgi:hypothetical protein